MKPRITLVNVKEPVVATTNWWWLRSGAGKSIPVDFMICVGFAVITMN